MDYGLESFNNTSNTMQARWGRLHGFRKLINHEFNDSFSIPVVDRLQTHWEDSHTKLLDRVKHLHSMQQDSINWLDARKRVEMQISRASARLESWPGITYTVDDLKKQNTELMVGL